jgi:hypothetical protein
MRFNRAGILNRIGQGGAGSQVYDFTAYGLIHFNLDKAAGINSNRGLIPGSQVYRTGSGRDHSGVFNSAGQKRDIGTLDITLIKDLRVFSSLILKDIVAIDEIIGCDIKGGCD